MKVFVPGTLLCALLCLLPGWAGALSDGPRSPSALGNDATLGTLAWLMPGEAAESDDVRATAAAIVLVNTQGLRATGFGFAVPADAVITGIEVHVERSALLGLTSDHAVRLVKGGVIGAADRSGADPWPTAAGETVATYGGPGDLWGESWTPADINDSGFGAAIAARVAAADAAGVDHLAITVHYVVCGDGIVSDGEDCDDGNTDDGDCCSATCTYELAGSPCPDDDLCNGAETCDGAGTCTAGTPPSCDDGDLCTADTCDPQLGCQHDGTPRSGCRQAGKSVLVHRRAIPESRDRLVWKWVKGEATTTPEFGIPSSHTDYALCVHVGDELALSAQVPASGLKWTPIGGEGFKYSDPSRTPDGIKKMSLRSGKAGRARIRVLGKGASLGDGLSAPLALPVVVQLVSDSSPLCFESTFTNPAKNADGFFKAKE